MNLITYLRLSSFILPQSSSRHEDSAGHAGTIEAGGVQWMCAVCHPIMSFSPLSCRASTGQGHHTRRDASPRSRRFRSKGTPTLGRFAQAGKVMHDLHLRPLTPRSSLHTVQDGRKCPFIQQHFPKINYASQEPSYQELGPASCVYRSGDIFA